MNYKKKLNSTKGRNKNHSVSNKLRKENKVTDEFEVMLNNLSLEELIALKLELAAKAAGGMLYGLPIWYSMQHIIKDAVLKYAYSATRRKWRLPVF